MLGNEHTVGSITTTDAQKIAHADKSLEWNFAKFDRFETLFNSFFEVIGINPATKKRELKEKEENKEE